MNLITQFLSGLNTASYILLYCGCFLLAVIITIVCSKTKLKLYPLIPVFGLLGGMLAVGYVTIKLELNAGIGILFVLTIPAVIIIFSCFGIEKLIDKPKALEKSAGVICSAEGHQWEPTEYACTTKCVRCGKTKVKHQFEEVSGSCEQKCSACGYTETVPHKWEGCKCSRCGQKRDKGHVVSDFKYSDDDRKVSLVCSICGDVVETKDLFDCSKKEILSVINVPGFQADDEDMLCRYLEKKGSKSYSRGVTDALLKRLTETQIFDLVKAGKIKGQNKWALAEAADKELLNKLCGIDEISYVAQSELRKRDNIEKEKHERTFCPDGNPHEFGEEYTEQDDMGPKGDDDLAAHVYQERKCRKCSKCGYVLTER